MENNKSASKKLNSQTITSDLETGIMANIDFHGGFGFCSFVFLFFPL